MAPATAATPPGPPGRVLVTGAAGALGGSVVRRFLAAGARVLAADRDAAALAALAEAAGADGRDRAAAPGSAAGSGAAERAGHDSAALETAALDLADPAAVAALFDRAERGGGAPSAVAHLVGGFRMAPLAETSDDDWRFLLTVNLETTFLVLREAARRFAAAGGGSLVAVSAPAALLGEAEVGPYSATKAAVLRLVESLARELEGCGARANAVLPGTMDTPANRAAMPEADASRWVSTDAVAEVVFHLTTPAAGAINGAAIRVPGPAL
jgi:NAD(P)-dependent dehydrogenase (short-subunit alcohol dehydrogenase family)